jgi:hypothetical protein
LRRLLVIVAHRLPFAERVTRLRRQRQWLIQLDRLLDPEQWLNQPPTSLNVSQAVDQYLIDLVHHVAIDAHPEDRLVAVHINQTFRNRWWGLFTCYDVEGLPRTNNELETYFGRIKTGQRRVSGRKNVHDFVIRYGSYVSCLDHRESVDDLLARLSQVPHDDFLREREALNASLLREQKRHRFRHHRETYLQELEQRWSEAVDQATS